eukprot:gnl/TRDRNA2_/TRDRNA2_179019_c0_seq1.p1 gnl/TRDRNA2_/TRDRNA2_179019_c0~~gnl/TRDRNA2_/TRDRNA2_179019_c0_seq1.p1  ORF type:complete len:299 (-),score=48.89 gnl/TRDRNA2_/TRDRNA2_179019_c0_seq1:75-971(-)
MPSWNESTPINNLPSSGPGVPGAQKKLRGRGGRVQDLLVIIVLPWLVFVLITCLFVFSYEEFRALVWALVTTCVLLSILFIAVGTIGKKSVQLAMGFLCFAAVAVAVATGMFIEGQYTKEYWRLDGGSEYDNLSPTEYGPAHKDATIINFAKGSFVDAQRARSYMHKGDVYCVAPISGPSYSRSPAFWATGENCCGHSTEFNGNEFTCGDVEDQSARGGIVINENERYYRTAIRMAGATYDLSLNSTEDTILVAWTKDPDTVMNDLWSNAVLLVAVAALLHLVASGLATCFLSRVLPT